MANRALSELKKKAQAHGGIVTILGIGWIVSIPIALVSVQNSNWGWLAFAVILHMFCSSWFFFWFFYAEMATLFYMNAASVVEAIEATGLRTSSKTDEVNPNSSSNLITDTKPKLPAAATPEMTGDQPQLVETYAYWCVDCNQETVQTMNRRCSKGHYGVTLMERSGASRSHRNYCKKCDHWVLGEKKCLCPICLNATTINTQNS